MKLLNLQRIVCLNLCVWYSAFAWQELVPFRSKSSIHHKGSQKLGIRSHPDPLGIQPQDHDNVGSENNFDTNKRRVFLQLMLFSMSLGSVLPAHAAPLDESLSLVRQARAQLAAVPDLIKAEKWDSVRAILITPPLSDCWAKTNRPLLQNYAEAVGDAGKDELAALEAKEDANSHLRYLDMAVYNK